MRRPIMAGLVAGLVFGSTGTAVLAQDDATGAEPAAAERVEVAEAGVAMSFPASWNIDVEMREREDFWLSERFPQAAPVLFWDVLYASDGGRPWCDLTWYPEHPTSLAEHATDYGALMTPTGATNVERPIEVTPVELASGEAYRFLIFNEPSDTWTTTYLLADDQAHYMLRCVSDDRDSADWLPLVESVESLDADQAVAPDATAQP